jgi:hypothetical protein
VYHVSTIELANTKKLETSRSVHQDIKLNSISIIKFDVKAFGAECLIYAGTVNKNKKVFWGDAMELKDGEVSSYTVQVQENEVNWSLGEKSMVRLMKDVRLREADEFLIF